jgi:alkanesulfonate monooxygenase SsuD/methylene tetrahydromethanopterin reductase-like flavin-dependent oxidoreductase (luciferase family)
LDAWITLAALAAQTNRSKLGTRVSPLPFYLPGRLAKMVTTVDIISNGRVIFGAGAAGHKTEGIAYGVGWWRHKERIKRMIEEIKIILKFWKENEATYKGRYYSVTKAPFWPKPIQKPHPPIWFGGSGDSIVKATVKYGEGIFPFPNMPLEKLEDLNKRIREEEKNKGRKKPVILAPSLVYPDGIGKTHSQWIEKIQEQKNIGAELIMFDLSARAVPPEESQKFLKDFALTFLLKE